MYLVFALLAPIAMFGLLPGLAWFEERMLGPAASRNRPDATPDTGPGGAEAVSATTATPSAALPTRNTAPAGPPRTSPIPFQPGQSTAVTPQVTPLTAVPDPAVRHAGHSVRKPVRHSTAKASPCHRHTLKRRRGLRAA